MNNLRTKLQEHRHFIIVVTLLTLVMTFPTIVYVFRTDVFWLPTGKSIDVFIKLWDVWYGKQILTGQADRFYTELIFYPEGVSLVNHPFFMPQVIVVSLLQMIMPLSNAYNLSFLFIIFSSAIAAYIYLLWLYKDKWLALFGAVVFGFSPNVLGNPNWPETAWLAIFPLVLYCFHRGVAERRAGLIVLAGILAGLTTVVTLYHYVQVIIMLGLAICAFAVSRWRDSVYWQHVILLIVAVGLFSAWRVSPMLQRTTALDEAMTYYHQGESHSDLVYFLASPLHPFLGPLAEAIFQTPDSDAMIRISYLGLAPLALIGIGLYRRGARRKMLPWLGLCLVFLVLRLGSTLQINGTEFDGILLPKYYLDQLFPSVFEAFNVAGRFMAGARLPLAVLSCFGLIALRDLYPVAARPRFILALILIVAFEYFIPVRMQSLDPITHKPFTEERLAFLDWLEGEETDDIRLINLPFGRDNAKLYSFYQVLGGYPQTEGAISRPPDSAYDYIRANQVLSIWYEHRPTNCVIQVRDDYLEGLTQLVEDGFSHIVHHRGFYFWERHLENFRYVDPAYSDDYVSIYRLSELIDSCPN